MDVLGPLPVTDRGMKYILVVMDYFSKWPEVFALEDQQADTIVKCLLEVISRHGAMKILLSDQRSIFESQKVKDLCELYGIDKRRTSHITRCVAECWKDSTEHVEYVEFVCRPESS